MKRTFNYQTLGFWIVPWWGLGVVPPPYMAESKGGKMGGKVNIFAK